MEALDFLDHQKVVIFFNEISCVNLSESLVKHLHHCPIAAVDHTELKIDEFRQTIFDQINDKGLVDSALFF
jgi:hypothetical protein